MHLKKSPVVFYGMCIPTSWSHLSIYFIFFRCLDTHSLTLTLSHTHTHSHTHTLTRSLSHTHTLTHSHTPTHSLTHSRFHTHSLTHTHTHTRVYKRGKWHVESYHYPGDEDGFTLRNVECYKCPDAAVRPRKLN
jgi:hypothetical protein